MRSRGALRAPGARAGLRTFRRRLCVCRRTAPFAMPSLHLVADANIPRAREAFGSAGEVTALPASGITPAAVRDADVLLVRSVTRVDEALVAGSRLAFVGTATIGTDHVDAEALARRGIAFASAPGSNAESVVEWTIAALVETALRQGVPLGGKTVGIVGIGDVGGRLAPRLAALGLPVVVCDPPRQRRGDVLPEGATGDWLGLDALLAAADIVTLHVPLVRAGADATRGLLSSDRLDRMRPSAWLVNASRGDVVDGDAVRFARSDGRLGALLLDVFPGEPTPDPALVAACDLATPHIAGHSVDGKVGGTRMLRDALNAWLVASGRPAPPAFDWTAALALTPDDARALPSVPEDATDVAVAIGPLVRTLYPIAADDARLRACLRCRFGRQAGTPHFGVYRKECQQKNSYAIQKEVAFVS